MHSISRAERGPPLTCPSAATGGREQPPPVGDAAASHIVESWEKRIASFVASNLLSVCSFQRFRILVFQLFLRDKLPHVAIRRTFPPNAIRCCSAGGQQFLHPAVMFCLRHHGLDWAASPAIAQNSQHQRQHPLRVLLPTAEHLHARDGVPAFLARKFLRLGRNVGQTGPAVLKIREDLLA